MGSSIINFSQKNEYPKIEVGYIYAHSYKWESDNPFDVPKIDTIKILEIRGDYALWQFKKGLALSTKIEFLQKNVKPIDQKKWHSITFKKPFKTPF